jgi:predicted dehydrogenase
VPVGSHHFDRVVQMMAQGTLEHASEMRAVENEDECTILARFENGAHGFLRASRVRSGQRLLVSGARGELLWRLDGDRLWARRVPDAEYVEVELVKETNLPTFVDPLLHDIAYGTDLGPSFYDGVQAQAVMEAVLAFGRNGHWAPVPRAEQGWPWGLVPRDGGHPRPTNRIPTQF